MDKFALTSILIAVLVEVFILWGGTQNPQENTRNIIVATSLPIVLIGTVVLFHFLQRGET